MSASSAVFRMQFLPSTSTSSSLLWSDHCHSECHSLCFFAQSMYFHGMYSMYICMSVFGLRWFFKILYKLSQCVLPTSILLILGPTLLRFFSMRKHPDTAHSASLLQCFLDQHLPRWSLQVVTFGDKSINSPGSSLMLVSGLGLKWLRCALGY